MASLTRLALPRAACSSSFLRPVTSVQARTVFSTPSGPDKRTTIVTGSSRGIGKAIALRLAEDGYDVCINDVKANEAGAHEVAQQIQDLGRKSTVAIADVAHYDQVEGMIQHSLKELGDLNTM
jgi:NAD(P)-dependent dehydrogenase (short-subunit alcohol dehydrogenase family)